jgi:hypothetical protein
MDRKFALFRFAATHQRAVIPVFQWILDLRARECTSRMTGFDVFSGSL